MIWFILGLSLGGSIALGVYLSAMRKNVGLDEEKQLLQQEQQTVVEFMHELVEAVGRGADRKTLFQQIVHAAILGTGATSSCFFEYKKGKLSGVAVEGLFPPFRPISETYTQSNTSRVEYIQHVLQSETFELGEGIVGSVARSMEGLYIPDAHKEPRLVRHEDPALEIRSMILVPLKLRDQLTGVLAVSCPTSGNQFTNSDYSMLMSLAEQASLAIHNADLMALQIEKNQMDMDLSLASSIQHMLLPQIFPDVEGLKISAHYKPAQKVGGDLYDVFSIGENKVGLAIADVSGKGIPASLLMAICQTNLRHYSQQVDSPSDVLKAMNHELMNEMRQDMFITIIYGIVDMKQKTVTITRAGHELPIHCIRQDDGTYRTETVSSEGMALGMVPADVFDSVVADKTIPFHQGDTLMLYTDGITEITNVSDEEFSNKRLSEILQEIPESDPDAINKKVMEAMASFSGGVAAGDDVTLITIKHQLL